MKKIKGKNQFYIFMTVSLLILLTAFYLNSKIPFFFISAISHIHFTVKDTKFDDSWVWSPGENYAVGVLRSQEDDALRDWGFGLYNDEKTEDHVKEMYSRIFMKIAELNL